ncbi:MAG TPA: hypothetical protein VEW28_08730 [Candidatus Kapabacteria bacterium]|nr:hypothetical protein [Candidatus Kapabacteria bacterium]
MLLEKAFTEAKKLNNHDQDALAAIIMEELLAERTWDEAFERSHEKLEQLADDALRQLREGNVKPLSFH